MMYGYIRSIVSFFFLFRLTDYISIRDAKLQAIIIELLTVPTCRSKVSNLTGVLSAFLSLFGLNMYGSFLVVVFFYS